MEFAPQQQTQQQPAKKKPETDSEINSQVASIANRLRLIEERLDSLRNHLTVVESSVVEKHKSNITEIRDMQAQMQEMRTETDATKDIMERIAKRLDAFASREEVKVLQRYVDLWQPMKFVTRSELTNIIQRTSEQQHIKKI